MVAISSTYPAGARFMTFVIGIPAVVLCVLQLVLDIREARHARRAFHPFLDAIHVGLPVLVVEETAAIKAGDHLRVDVEAHIVHDRLAGVALRWEGAVVHFPPGPEGAHQVRGPGTLLVFAADRAPETVEYPDSGKVGAMPPRMLFRLDDAVDFWEGE